MLARVRFGLAALALLHLAALAAIFGLIAAGTAEGGWPAFLREMTPYLFSLVPFLLLAGLVLRARVALTLTLLPLALFVYLCGTNFVPKAPPTATGPGARVFTFNVGAARGLGQPESVVRAVRAADPDVAFIVEARGNSLDSVGATLTDAYPYQAGNGSVFVFSRLPLLDPRGDLLRSGAHDSLLVDVELDGRLVAFMGVHLRRTDTYPGLGRGVRPLVQVGRQYRTDRRDAAVAELTTILRGIGGPRVLVGDFNMTAWSRSYEQVTADLRDSHLEAGWGFGHTYPTTLRPLGLSVPLLRIDYIFHTADLATVRAWVGPDGGSDHLPIVADLALR
ncbi:MAG: endonuclease/exonuclease/phosphatase family protein [Chloroflexota bacterium]|nr:endonuclease/exonuclease/phosphatase family protein [Chloroflexota bacterium]